MNLVKQDGPAHTPERAGHPGSSTDGSKERTITFRTRKDMYEPRARQLLSAEEQAEEEAYLASTEVPTVAMASESLESGGVPSEPSAVYSAGSDGTERAATLRAAQQSPAVVRAPQHPFRLGMAGTDTGVAVLTECEL